MMILAAAFALLLLLECGLLQSVAHAQQQAAPSVPLNIYVPAHDVNALFAGAFDADNRVDLVRNGAVSFDVLNTSVGSMALPIPSYVSYIPISFLMCAQNVAVNISWVSMARDIMSDPLISIPMSFVFPSCPYSTVAIMLCNESLATSNTVPTKLTINASTDHMIFKPIVMYISKCCERMTPNGFGAIREFPANFSRANNVTLGCFDDPDPPTKPVVARSSSDTPTGVIVAAVVTPIVVLLVVVAMVTVAVVWYFYRYRGKAAMADFTIDMLKEQYECHNPLFDRVVPTRLDGPHEKEFPPAKIMFVRELGEGAFGRVYQGAAEGIVEGEESSIVAVKQLKVDPANAAEDIATDFFKEVDFMSRLSHPRVVRLLGVCTLGEPYCMVFEYMDLGDLNGYLRTAIGLGPDCGDRGGEQERPSWYLTLADLLAICIQVAEGMEYLSNKRLVHRDLATRNCLVATGLVVKISDFGLSRDVNSTDYYRVRGRAVLPIRWMAPESIMYGRFTVATDIWSYGVVVWEVFTYGEQPYVGLTNEEVVRHVIKEGTPQLPDGCPSQVVKVMSQCWTHAPRGRPQFSQLCSTLRPLCSALKDVSYLPPGYGTSTA